MRERIIKALCAAAGAVAGLFGGWPAAMTVLVAVMGIDYVTGVLAGALGRSDKTEGGGLSSRAGFAGLARKGFIMLIVLLATLLDRAVGNAAMVFQSATAFYYIANEGISILENTALMGVAYPAVVRNALESLRENAEKGPA